MSRPSTRDLDSQLKVVTEGTCCFVFPEGRVCGRVWCEKWRFDRAGQEFCGRCGNAKNAADRQQDPEGPRGHYKRIKLRPWMVIERWNHAVCYTQPAVCGLAGAGAGAGAGGGGLVAEEGWNCPGSAPDPALQLLATEDAYPCGTPAYGSDGGGGEGGREVYVVEVEVGVDVGVGVGEGTPACVPTLSPRPALMV